MPIIEAPSHRRTTTETVEPELVETIPDSEVNTTGEAQTAPKTKFRKPEPKPVSAKTWIYAVLAMVVGIALPLGYYLVKNDKLTIDPFFTASVSEQEIRNLQAELDYYVVQASKAILIRREIDSVMADIEILTTQGNEDSTTATAMEAIHLRKRDELKKTRGGLTTTLLSLHESFKKDPEKIGGIIVERIESSRTARKEQEADILNTVHETMERSMLESQVSAFIHKVVDEAY